MYKLVYCIAKKADISFAEFSRYWREEHGPLVKSFAKDMHAKRYVQSHAILPEVNPLLQQPRGMPAGYDGITEIWWSTRADFDAAMSTPEGQAAGAALLNDESTFIDFEKSTIFMTQEHEIFDFS